MLSAQKMPRKHDAHELTANPSKGSYKMKPSTHKIVDLEFSQKYDRKHAEAYYRKHRQGIWRRWSHAREERVSRQALILAGQPKLVLDLPCGAGRFWPLLLEEHGRQVIGADYSAGMLEVAQDSHPGFMDGRVRCLQTSAFSIDLPDAAVDSVFCMRLMHHVGKAGDRMVLLKEFHRVSRDTSIISLWVDGNYKAWRRKKAEQKRVHRSSQNRFVIEQNRVEEEFAAAGFEVLGKIDFLPFYQMWRTYVLRKR